MANLYEVLADAQNGEAITELGREFGLSSQQTQAALAALLPAISMGLKRTTATPEGLGDLFALMGAQPDLYAMYDDPQLAFSREGRAAGNAALSRMFGSPDASRAIADHAQQVSGISSTILKKLLPVLVGILISSLMKSGSGKAAPSAPETSPEPGGGHRRHITANLQTRVSGVRWTDCKPSSLNSSNRTRARWQPPR